jgi:hypothetical protein
MLLLAQNRITQIADRERARILREEILAQPDIRLYPLPENEASHELAGFAAELWKAPKMEGYFDPGHFANLKQNIAQARHGFVSVLCHLRPRRFLVDAGSQISQPRTGEPFKRIVYYLKRGYYPPDQKLPADACLLRLVRGTQVRKRTILRLMKKSNEPFWVFPAFFQ